MNPQLADSDYSGDDIVLLNSPITKAGQLPVNGSPLAVPHTKVTDPVSSVVQEMFLKNYHTLSDSTSRPESPRPITNSSNIGRRKQADVGLELGKNPDSQADIHRRKTEHELNDLLTDLNRKDKDLNDLLADLNRKDEELTSLRNETDAALNWKNQELNELHDRTEKKDQEINEYRQRWKQVANELNRFLAQGQGFYQVTDQQLIEAATQLRFNIRNFADQQFGGEVRDAKTYQHFRDSIKNYYEISSDSFEACMVHSSRRPMLVKAFLWAILRKDIFGNFCWAGTRGSHAMSILEDLLQPVRNDTLGSDPDAKRKFQMWRANTTTLLLNSQKMDEGDGDRFLETLNEELHKVICESLSPFSKSKYKDLADKVFFIVQNAINLDKMISMQIAEVSWYPDCENDTQHFSQDLMELQRGEKQEQVDDSGNTWLVSAPGMIKRGKSTGEDFDVENILLKMEVFCEPGTMEHTAESHRNAVGSLINRTKDLFGTRK